MWITAGHDGYLAETGLIHTRTLTLSADGRRLDGRDRLEPPHGVLRLKRDEPFAVHFHLSPQAGCRRVGRGGPVLIELNTYRYRGHSMSDPAKYRTREEVDKVRELQDPIEQLRRRLVDGGLASEDELKALDKDVRRIVNEAAEFSQSDPEPDPGELYTDVLLPA